jgi:hypothetical protein
MKCTQRERNKGLFLADQFSNNDLVSKNSAIYTRQVKRVEGERGERGREGEAGSRYLSIEN